MNNDLVIVVSGPYAGCVGPRSAFGNSEVKPMEGGVVSRADYPELYAAIGHMFGPARGEAEEFHLPDFRGRIISEEDHL